MFAAQMFTTELLQICIAILQCKSVTLLTAADLHNNFATSKLWAVKVTAFLCVNPCFCQFNPCFERVRLYFWWVDPNFWWGNPDLSTSISGGTVPIFVGSIPIFDGSTPVFEGSTLVSRMPWDRLSGIPLVLCSQDKRCISSQNVPILNPHILNPWMLNSGVELTILAVNYGSVSYFRVTNILLGRIWASEQYTVSASCRWVHIVYILQIFSHLPHLCSYGIMLILGWWTSLSELQQLFWENYLPLPA